jgi:fatty acid desaturase
MTEQDETQAEVDKTIRNLASMSKEVQAEASQKLTRMLFRLLIWAYVLVIGVKVFGSWALLAYPGFWVIAAVTSGFAMHVARSKLHDR